VNNIKINVGSLHDIHRQIRKYFKLILSDYAERFNVEVTSETRRVDICIIEYPQNEDGFGELGCTHEGESGNILVQVHDPFLNGGDYSTYTTQHFLTVLTHELIHVCQILTGREGIPVKCNTKDTSYEHYFFDPEECEARLLESFYVAFFARDIFKFEPTTLYEED
jgi:hypothetical protein